MNPIAATVANTIAQRRYRDKRKTMPLVDTAALEKEFGWNAYMRFITPLLVSEKGVTRIRATMPKDTGGNSGIIRFVWRWLAFILSTDARHHYVPIGFGETYLNDCDYAHRTDKKNNYPQNEWVSQIRIVPDNKTAMRIGFMDQELFPFIDQFLKVQFGLESNIAGTVLRRKAMAKTFSEYR